MKVTARDLQLDGLLNGLSVLVLEDEYVLAADAQGVLSRAGARVIGPFGSAIDALAAAERSRPDCALLDLDLGTGLDFAPARALRQRGVPLVFFTGYDMSVVPADLRKERFLEKPVFMAAIVDVVASACAGARGRRAAEDFGHAHGQAGFWRTSCP